jgi:hypothetical protein
VLTAWQSAFLQALLQHTGVYVKVQLLNTDTSDAHVMSLPAEGAVVVAPLETKGAVGGDTVVNNCYGCALGRAC